MATKIKAKFGHLKVGDNVIRLLAGKIPHKLTVTEIKDDRLVCGWWEFDPITGAEIDEDLNWGPPPKMTGSFITDDYVLLKYNGKVKPLDACTFGYGYDFGEFVVVKNITGTCGWIGQIKETKHIIHGHNIDDIVGKYESLK